MEYFILDGQEQKGPFSTDELRQMLAAGECTDETLAWHEGLQDWERVATLLSASLESAQEGDGDLQPVAKGDCKENSPTPPSGHSAPWYDRSVVIFPALLFCFPLGLVPLWITSRFRTKTKAILSATIVSAYFLMLVSSLVVSFASGKRKGDNAKQPSLSTHRARGESAVSARSLAECRIFDGRVGTGVERADVFVLSDLVEGFYDGKVSLAGASECIFLPPAQEGDVVQELAEFLIVESTTGYRGGVRQTVDFALSRKGLNGAEFGTFPVRMAGTIPFTTKRGVVRILPVVERVADADVPKPRIVPPKNVEVFILEDEPSL